VTAPIFVVQWASTDSQILSLLASLSSASLASTTNSTRPSTLLTTRAQTLSGGAIAGIVVGVVAACVILGIIVLWMRKHKKRDNAEPDMIHEKRETWEKPELEAAATNPPVELPAEDDAVELEGPPRPVMELPIAP
jgi:tetrahydromethanopterin S-methyltransferase subunit F